MPRSAALRGSSPLSPCGPSPPFHRRPRRRPCTALTPPSLRLCRRPLQRPVAVPFQRPRHYPCSGLVAALSAAPPPPLSGPAASSPRPRRLLSAAPPPPLHGPAASSRRPHRLLSVAPPPPLSGLAASSRRPSRLLSAAPDAALSAALPPPPLRPRRAAQQQSRRAAQQPSRRAAQPPSRPAAEPPSSRAAEPPSSRAAEPPCSRAADLPSSRAAEPPSSRAAEPPSSRAAETPSCRAAYRPAAELPSRPAAEPPEPPCLVRAAPLSLHCPHPTVRAASLLLSWLPLVSSLLTLRIDDLQLFLQCDRADGLSLFDLTSGSSPAPTTDADATVRSQWATRHAAARLAVRRHLPTSERAHFSQYKSAQTLYDAVVARYSSPATAALSRLMLPYLFPDLAAFPTAADLITHLRTSDTRYRAALPAEFCAKNPPPPPCTSLSTT
ncbi:unnamed protein product [Closterium sp. NIES-65]|nr:unnamed protein product [Closterium sp. NIES-65]